MMCTKYRHLTDEEFLNICQEKRHQSPIINELCQRLEEFIYSDQPVTDEINLELKNEHRCPVCETKIEIEFSSIDDKISFKPKE